MRVFSVACWLYVLEHAVVETLGLTTRSSRDGSCDREMEDVSPSSRWINVLQLYGAEEDDDDPLKVKNGNVCVSRNESSPPFPQLDG